MVTHYPQIASGETLTSADDASQSNDGMVARTRAWLAQAYCGLHGHDRLLHFEKDRIALRCVSCGQESPGWELKGIPRPAVRVRTEPRRKALRPQLVSARRIA